MNNSNRLITMSWPQLCSKDRRDSKDTASLNVAIRYATKNLFEGNLEDGNNTCVRGNVHFRNRFDHRVSRFVLFSLVKIRIIQRQVLSIDFFLSN